MPILAKALCRVSADCFGLVSALYIIAWYCNGATAAASVPVFCCACFILGSHTRRPWACASTVNEPHCASASCCIMLPLWTPKVKASSQPWRLTAHSLSSQPCARKETTQEGITCCQGPLCTRCTNLHSRRDAESSGAARSSTHQNRLLPQHHARGAPNRCALRRKQHKARSRTTVRSLYASQCWPGCRHCCAKQH